MPDTMLAPSAAAETTTFDAIVIGAGIAGIYQLYRLRELGLSVRVFETGGGVGGTWYWNRYPGARFDSESYTYGYAFSEDLLRDWNWSEHFAPQPETERYLNHVVDRFDLRRDIQCGSRVRAAAWDEATRHWDITLDDGQAYRCRFLVTAVGPLSADTLPRFEGIASFRGRSFHTYRWPHEAIDFAGKRVAVIGTGATGVQVIQTIAPLVGSLTVFQRTANWCTPLHNKRITEEEQARIKAGYPAMFELLRQTPGCYIHDTDPRGTFEVRAWVQHLDGEFSGCAHGSEGQRAVQRIRRSENPDAGDGPSGGGEADPAWPRLWDATGASRDEILRSLQPAACPSGGYAGDADLAGYRDRDCLFRSVV
jgi:thioredoxin reductase